MSFQKIRRGLLLAPLMAACLGSASGCGGDGVYSTAVTGTWQTPGGVQPPSGYSAYSAKLAFGSLTDVNYSLTDTIAGTGTRGGCQETVTAAGTYLLQGTNLVVVFTSGTLTRVNCTNAADNVAMRAFDNTDKALYTALVSGTFAVSGTTLTIGISVMGVASMTTYTKQ